MVLQITIPDDKKDLVINAFCDSFGYQETIGGQPNPETKSAFTKRKVIEFVKNISLSYEQKLYSNSFVGTNISIT